jgi:hypothetical protein
MPVKVPLTPEEYLAKILKEIDVAQEQHRNGVFKVNEKVSDNVANYVKNYLIANTKYRIEFRRCPSCKRTWDIMIIF